MKPSLRLDLILCVLLLLPAIGCNSDQTEQPAVQKPAPQAAAGSASPGQSSDPAPPAPENKDNPADAVADVDAGQEELAKVFQPWKGDLPDMIKRGYIRALVPWSDTYYYLDGAKQQGIAYEAMTEFEKWLNDDLGTGTVGIHVLILPVRRDQMLEYVAQGRGDVALGGVTITQTREQLVDFTEPASKEIQEILVESSAAEPLGGIDDLAGRSVYVRKSSSYWESLQTLNESLTQRGLQPVDLNSVEEYLSTEDLLQMANAGHIPYTIADNEIADFWGQVLTDVRVREDIVLRKGARYGWALRKASPEFMGVLNRFLDGHRAGTLIGNVVIKRYLGDASRLHKINGQQEQERFNQVIDYFRQYSGEYDFDALMMVAQGFQESRLDQSLKSHRGAVGIMQLLPSTASGSEVGIDDITTAQNNILAGIRYMAWIRDTYLDDPALDDFNKTAMAFASYNAGPNRIRGLRDKAKARGLNPDIWFDNVELVAAKDIGGETVDYVSNIVKYYVAYKLSREQSNGK